MKKILLIIISIISLLLPQISFAQFTAPQGGTGLSTFTAGDMIYANTTNPIRFTKLPIGNNGFCLTSNGTIPVWGSCGAGGSGGGTWSTTTSQTLGILINYTNNTTDIACIGGTSTSTCKFFFDPNTQIAYLGSGLVGIGTTSPTKNLVVATTTSADTQVETINSLYKLDFGVDSVSTFIQSRTALNASADLNTYIGNTLRTTLDTGGDFGVGSSSPFARLSAAGSDTSATNFGLQVTNSTNVPILSVNNAGSVGITATSSLKGRLQVGHENILQADGLATFIATRGGTAASGPIYGDTAFQFLSATNGGATHGMLIKLSENSAARDILSIVSAASPATSTVFKSTGRIGIGTTTPDNKVVISQGSVGNGVTQGALVLDSTYAGITSVATLDFLINGRNTNQAARIGVPTNSSGVEGALAFYTAASITSAPASEKVRFAGDGNVGVGTTSPYQKLSVAGGNVHVGGIVISTSTTASNTFPYASTTGLSVGGRTIAPTYDKSVSWASSTPDSNFVSYNTATSSRVIWVPTLPIGLTTIGCKVTKGSGTAHVAIGTGAASTTLPCTTTYASTASSVTWTAGSLVYVAASSTAPSGVEDLVITGAFYNQ